MPRRTRNTRKKEPSVPSAASKKKITAIAENTEGESVESLLDDFDIQSKTFGSLTNIIIKYFTAATLAKQSLKQFEKEAKLMLSALPLKSSIPKVILTLSLHAYKMEPMITFLQEVLKMELSEFICKLMVVIKTQQRI